MSAIPSAPVAPDDDPLSSPLIRLMMLATWLAIPLIVAVRPLLVPVVDEDIWWHLRVGQWIAEHGTVTTTDPFSQYGQDRPWVAYSWFFEVAVHVLYRAFGLLGIVVFRTLLVLAIIWAFGSLIWRLEKRFLVAIALTTVTVLAVALLFSERPWLFTVLFSTLTLHAIVVLRDTEKRPPPWIWALPLVYVLWANIHIQFVYGLFLLFLACVTPLLERRLGWRTQDESAAWPGSPRWYRLVVLSGLCFLATFVNPYHVLLYRVIVEYAMQPGPFLWINELKALEFRAFPDWIVLALTLTACYFLGRRQPSLFEILLLASAACFAFRAKRDVWFLVLADLLILASAGPRQVPESQRFQPSLPARGFLVLALLLFAFVLAWVRDLSNASLEQAVEKKFPVAAVRFIQDQGYTGPLYNDFNWGGFLIWNLPNLPVAMDGRTNLHGDERIQGSGNTWSGYPEWRENGELAHAGVILANKETALAELLRQDRRFRLVYEDELACVFVPAGSAGPR